MRLSFPIAAAAILGLALALAPSAAAGDGIELKLEQAFKTEAGRALPPVEIHAPALKAEHARGEERLRAYERIEIDLAHALVTAPAEATGAAESAAKKTIVAEITGAEAALRAVAGTAQAAGELAAFPTTAEARAALFDTYRLAAERADAAANALRAIEAQYLDLFPEPDPGITDAARAALMASLRKRAIAALAVREAAVDDYLRATVAAEGGTGMAAIARTVGFETESTLARTLQDEIAKLERERRALQAAIEEKSRLVEDLEKKRLAAAKAAADGGASFSAHLAEERLALEKLRQDAKKNDADTAEKRKALDRAALESQAAHAGGGKAGAAVARVAATFSPAYVALEIARRRLARASTEAEHLALMLASLASIELDRGLREQRRLMAGSVDFLDEFLNAVAATRPGPSGGDVVRGLRNATIDQGLAATLRRAIQTEDALLAQNEYLAAFSKVLSDRQLEAKTAGTRALQRVTNLGRGTLDLGAGILEALSDTLKQISGAGGLYQFKTKSEKTWATIRKERAKTIAREEFLEQVRVMSDEELAGLVGAGLRQSVAYGYREPVPLGSPGDARKLLEQDRAFFEATNGGLSRIASALDTTLVERLETEYLIACAHLALTCEDLEVMWRRRLGLDEKTGRLTPVILLSPTQIASAFQFRFGSRRPELEAHIRLRENQLAAMQALLPRWKAIGFDESWLAAPDAAAIAPDFVRGHGDLLASCPDYQRFWQTSDVERDSIERELFEAMAKEEEANGDRDIAETYARRAQEIAATPPPLDLLASSLMGKAIDLDFAGDYVGAFQALAQVNLLDWHLFPAEALSALEDSLAWSESRDLMVVRLRQIGDQCFYAALAARVFPGPLKPPGGWGSGFVKFAHAQVNPFASLMTTQALLGGEVRYVLFGLARGQVESLAAEALKDGMVSALGEDYEAVLEKLANAVVGAASWKLNKVLESSLYSKTARELKDLTKKLGEVEKLQEQAECAKEALDRRAAVKKLAEMTDLTTLGARVQALRARLTLFQKLDIAAEKGGEVEGLVKKIAATEAQIARLRSPVTARKVENVVAALHRGLESADADERTKYNAELRACEQRTQIARITQISRIVGARPLHL